jgi:hypothetical protein
VRRLTLVSALAALLALGVASVADAHHLSKKRAAEATVDTEKQDCDHRPDLYPGCTGTDFSDCRRLTKHKVKCTGHILGQRTNPETGVVEPYDCERVYTWKIKPGRRASLLFGRRGAQTCVIGTGADRRVRPGTNVLR